MEILTLHIKKWKKGNTGSDLSDYIPHFFLNVFFGFWWGRFAELKKNEINSFFRAPSHKKQNRPHAHRPA